MSEDRRGNTHSAEEVDKMQDLYVAARLDGNSQKDSREIAGYGKTNNNNLEAPGHPVREKIDAALKAKGIDVDFLAKEYSEGIQMARVDGARDKDLNSHAQYLKQLGFLMGFAKQQPSVAVQINNTNPQPSSSEIDPAAVARLVDLVREEITMRDSGGVHESHSGDADSQTHPGMDRPSEETR